MTGDEIGDLVLIEESQVHAVNLIFLVMTNRAMCY